MGKILVIGSSNTDLIARVKRFPASGETIEGTQFLQAMGGKGANQALAAHKLGAKVKFITCLGKDKNGENTLWYYHNEGLDVSSSLIIDNASSGTAMILVDDKGENCIVITPGANHQLTPEFIAKQENEIADAEMILLQMEIPFTTVSKVCELAKRHNKSIMLNVAPAHPLNSEMIKMIDILVVNETEAEIISGQKITERNEIEMVDKLLGMGARTVVMTLGRRGCIMKNKAEFHFVPAFDVKTLDTTAAGDTFCGALASELSNGKKWEEALKFATAASAICVTRMGAQPSIPSEKEVRDFLCNNMKVVLN